MSSLESTIRNTYGKQKVTVVTESFSEPEDCHPNDDLLAHLFDVEESLEEALSFCPTDEVREDIKDILEKIENMRTELVDHVEDSEDDDFYEEIELDEAKKDKKKVRGKNKTKIEINPIIREELSPKELFIKEMWERLPRYVEKYGDKAEQILFLTTQQRGIKENFEISQDDFNNNK